MSIPRCLFVVVSLVAAFSCASVANGADPTVPVASAGPKLQFNRDIRPILSENCFACHGFDAKKRQAELRLDTPEGALKSHDGPAAIVPGKPDESEVWKRVTTDDADLLMPPPASHKKLSESQKQTLRRWITEGASYQKHWAFEPPVAVAPPRVKNAAAIRNPIDAFIVARLDAAGLAMRPEADRETLIRRAAFALTGLPPTVAEVDAFVADKAPDAYERMVDRYLASPHFGEEMARHWLDVARYADTHGLHLDNERQMFAYRDWVIRAFNQNLPFDQFTIWQLAGDQLPNPTEDQLIATGFNRCNVTTSEGGSIAEEFLYRYAVDRASTTLETWLGLTGGCAVCHDHKFDPLTTKDFYSLYAFFYSAADPAMDGNTNTTAPFIRLPSTTQKRIAEAAGRTEREARTWLEAAAMATKYVDPADDSATPEKAAVRDVLIDDVLPPGTTFKNTSRNNVDWVLDPAFGAASGRRVLRQASSGKYKDDFDFKLWGPVMPTAGELHAEVRLDEHEPPQTVSITITGGKTITWTKTGDDLVRDGGKPIRRGTGGWFTLRMTADELGIKPSARLAGLTLNQEGGIAYWDAITLTGTLSPAEDPQASFAAWLKMHGKTAPPEIPGELAGLFRNDPKQPLTSEEREKLLRFYLAVVARPINDELQTAVVAWSSARTARIIAEESAPGTFVFGDLAQPREAFVMMRGEYTKPGDKVEPTTPGFLPPMSRKPEDGRARRLDLARWLVSPGNPLTARVQVNRLWQQFFGVGLVKTSFDFGSQGEVPSHPELLDWLALQYSDNLSSAPGVQRLAPAAWDTKALIRLMVTSAAFRQSSAAPADLRARDPENRLLARGPRFRLDAEQIRDNVLFVSGLMNFETGGRGVRIYQPPNIWEPVGYADSNTRFYLQDHGPALYRRSIYVFLKRTAPPPFMSNFDGPNREQFCAVRERSNTPMQALQLMNDVQHFEAARALAERTVAEGGKTVDDRIAFLYRTVLARSPNADELVIVRAAHDAQRKDYQSDPESAKSAIRVGESPIRSKATPVELAAWTLTANLILNLDETVTRN